MEVIGLEPTTPSLKIAGTRPPNIILTEQGHVKITDFGIAKRIRRVGGEEQEWTATLTQEAASLGTLPYMSPEQVKGQAL